MQQNKNILYRAAKVRVYRAANVRAYSATKVRVYSAAKVRVYNAAKVRVYSAANDREYTVQQRSDCTQCSKGQTVHSAAKVKEYKTTRFLPKVRGNNSVSSGLSEMNMV